ncbi:hypothetical protein CHS0354_031929 [Potamilus streckersoni]|uniref:Dihydrolipoamide acetyltransferase component of pyruvate dehydrogenase complex n=1 Tax=Potamilus streckersoni TaxID=2493646 RepID=A0AAE0VLY7_9BIVA|nr:hypothetical protein CHS0354_031929 [Potamilus streckersoni]
MAAAYMKVGRGFSILNYLLKPRKVSAVSHLSRNIRKQCGLYGTTKILMPALSPTMTEGTIVKWYKKEGDTVNPGDLLCNIKTDKADVGMDTEEGGILAKILKPDNSADVQIGTLIALLVEEGEDWQKVQVPTEVVSAKSAAQTTVSPQTQTTIVTETHEEAGHAASGIGPSVRKLLEEYGLTAGQVTSSGPHGRILKGDILKVIKQKNLQRKDIKAKLKPTPASPLPPPPPPPPVSATATASAKAPVKTLPPITRPPPSPPIEGEEYKDIPNTNIRRVIAKRLTESKTTIPHSYVTIDYNVGPVTKLRKQLTNENVKVSVNDFIIKAAAIALQRVPKVNSLWNGEAIQMSSTVDISVAVATSQGLITPIVKNAAYLGIDEISLTVKDLATRARDNKLQLHEFQGGSFTISNLGMFGISEFSAVINPPQTAIMAVGSSRLTLDEDGKPQTRMTATLSYDSRVLDEAEASEFLEVFRDFMENPNLTMSGSRMSKLLSAKN